MSGVNASAIALLAVVSHSDARKATAVKNNNGSSNNTIHVAGRSPKNPNNSGSALKATSAASADAFHSALLNKACVMSNQTLGTGGSKAKPNILKQ